MFAWIPTWLPLLPVAFAMVAVLVGSPYFWLRIAKVPPHVALIVAPPVTAVLVLILSVIYYRLGFFWSGTTVIPVLGVIGLTGAVFWWRRRAPSGSSPVGTPFGVTFAVTSILGFALAALPSMMAAPADNPVQQWDPSFHMNGVWGMTKLGIAAPQAGLAHNYGGGPATGYPIGWHAFTALFATAERTVQVANASTLAIMILWVVGAGVYTYMLYPSRLATHSAPIIAGTALAMPGDALTMYSQWPNALSLGYLPGVAAMALLTGRSFLSLMRSRLGAANEEPVEFGWQATAGFLVITFLGTLGGVLAHQVFAFNALVLLAPAVVAGGLALARLYRRSGAYGSVAGVLAVGVSGVSLVAYVMTRPELQSMRSYPRGGISVILGLKQAVFPTPPYPGLLGAVLYPIVLTSLVVLGTIWILSAGTVRAPWARWGHQGEPLLWPIWSWLAFSTLTFFAYAPDWPIRTWLVGPWFNDGRRIMEPASLAMVPLAAVGFTWLVVWMGRWWTMSFEPVGPKKAAALAWFMGVTLIMVTVFGAFDARLAGAQSVTDPDRLGRSGMADQELLDMMRELPDLIPEGALVLGDPQAGAMYSQMIGQRWAYFPQLSLLNKDSDTQSMLVHRFKYLNEDPAVCEAIKKAGVTHYLSTPDGHYFSRLRSDRMPGIYNVDTTRGFELVAEGGKARLYRITACD